MLEEQQSQEIFDEVISWRRYFHQFPELGFEEYKTSAKLQAMLAECGISFEVMAGTGVVGVLEGNGEGRTVAIRADMDALPIQEEVDLPFASRHPGVMHACCHDAHMATVLGVAKMLSRARDRLRGRFKFLFTPSEESPPGGVLPMIRAGAIDDVDCVLGMHYSDLPREKIWIGKGTIQANVDAFEIVIRGKGGHGAFPHQTNDPVVAAGYLITLLQTIVSRETSPLDSVVVTIGSVNAGTAFNVIPDRAVLKGTARTFTADLRARVEERIRQTVEATCQNFGCQGSVSYRREYPANVNDPNLAEEVRRLAAEFLPEDSFIDVPPTMGGDDFGYFAQKVPTCYIRIGRGTAEESGPNHSGKMVFDEDVLPLGTRLFAVLAARLAE